MAALMETQYTGDILQQLPITSKLLSVADKLLQVRVSETSLSVITQPLFSSIVNKSHFSELDLFVFHRLWPVLFFLHRISHLLSLPSLSLKSPTSLHFSFRSSLQRECSREKFSVPQDQMEHLSDVSP